METFDAIKQLNNDFYTACDNNDIDTVKLLLKNDKIDINEHNYNNYDMTPLIIACHKGNLEIVKLLLENDKINIHDEDECGINHLSWASKRGHIDIIEFCLEKKGLLNVASNDNYTELEIWLCFYNSCRNNHIDIIKLLLNNSSVKLIKPLEPLDKKKYCPLYTVCRYGYCDILILLLEDGRFDKYLNDNSNEDNYFESPLDAACYYNHINIVKILLEQKNIDVNNTNELNITPLKCACAAHNIDIVRLLLDDERIKVTFNDISSALCNYVDDVSVKIVKLLLDDKRIITDTLNLTDYDDDNTPFYIACFKGLTDIVKLLIDDGRIDINKYLNMTPFCAACRGHHTNIIKLLLETTGFNEQHINQGDNTGTTPLMHACYMDDLDLIKLLLKNDKIDVNKSDNRGMTAFNIACRELKYEIIDIFLNCNNVDVNKQDNYGRSPLANICLISNRTYISLDDNYCKYIKKLLNDERIDVNIPDNDGKIPLDYILLNDNSDLHDLLKEIKSFCNLN